jgi:peptide/nickel transport system substrate-binding protein
MKINLRWQLLLAVIGFGLILALLSFQVQTASLCTTRVPAAGGTFAEGIVGAPQFINPILSDPFPVDQELVNLIFDGLTSYDDNGRLIPNLAENWTVSEDGLTVLFRLRQDIFWHDGEQFTADDVVFTYRLLQDDAFPGPQALKTLWQSVTVNKLDTFSIEIILPELYVAILDTTTRGILPAHLLDGVSAVSLPAAPFNRTPIGTGPFMVEPGQNWERDHRLRLLPNPFYWRQGTQLAALEFRFYPSEAAMTDAFAAGNIQAINHVSQNMLPQIAAQPNVRLFTTAEPRYTTILFNLTDSGAPALQEAAVRRALAFALDRDKLVDDVLNGQGLPQEGPYLTSSWVFNPSLLTAHTYQPISATNTLDEIGWTLVDGGNGRQRDGEPLSIKLLTLDSNERKELADLIAAQWRDVGIIVEIQVETSTQAFSEALAAREYDAALVEISASGDPDLYDFWSQEAIVRGQNYSGWNNRRASEALENGRKIWSEEERRPYYNTFLRQYNNDLPAITLFQNVHTYALSKSVNEAEIGAFTSPRQRYQTFNDWFLVFRDVTISCPLETG